MKIEVDLNDVPALKSLEADLESTLSIVRFAIAARKKPQKENAETNGDDNETDKALAEIIATMPNSFTSAQLREKAGNKLTRDAVNAALKRAEGKLVRTTQRGVGRRPATLEKL